MKVWTIHNSLKKCSLIQCLLQDIHAAVICTYFYTYFAWDTRTRPSKNEGLVNGLEWKCTLHLICRHTSDWLVIRICIY